MKSSPRSWGSSSHYGNRSANPIRPQLPPVVRIWIGSRADGLSLPTCVTPPADHPTEGDRSGCPIKRHRPCPRCSRGTQARGGQCWAVGEWPGPRSGPAVDHYCGRFTAVKRRGPLPELELVNLDKAYGDVHALRQMSLTVESGEIFGFVGSNGAGKTTAMRIAVGVLAADAGEALSDRLL